MSTSSCFLLLLLCLSLHACNARRLAATDNKNLHKKFYISNQSDEKKVVAEKAESSSSLNKTTAAKVETNYHELADRTQTLKDLKTKEKTVIADNNGVQKVSVPWRVPHKKRGDKHPGFNLDYSPPKTHPPSHN